MFGQSPQKRIDKLIQRAEAMSPSPAQVALFEDAIALADKHASLYEQLQFRIELLEAAVFSGEITKMLDTFYWCLAKIDENPEEFSDSVLIWPYKWVIDHLSRFPDKSLEVIHAAYEDFTRRLKAAGCGMRSIYYLRWRNSLRMGNLADATEHFALWKRTSPDRYADCAACEINSEAEYYLAMGETEKGILTAGPITQGGMSCGEIPHLTYALLLRPLVRLGRIDQARAMSEKGWELVRGDAAYTTEAGEHLLLQTRLGEFQVAADFAEEMLPLVGRSETPYAHVLTCDSLSLYFEKLAAAPEGTPRPGSGKTKRRGRREPPQDLDPAEQAARFRAEVDPLVEAFNRRNGNSCLADQLAEKRKFLETP